MVTRRQPHDQRYLINSVGRRPSARELKSLNRGSQMKDQVAFRVTDRLAELAS